MSNIIKGFTDTIAAHHAVTLPPGGGGEGVNTPLSHTLRPSPDGRHHPEVTHMPTGQNDWCYRCSSGRVAWLSLCETYGPLSPSVLGHRWESCPFPGLNKRWTSFVQKGTNLLKITRFLNNVYFLIPRNLPMLLMLVSFGVRGQGKERHNSQLGMLSCTLNPKCYKRNTSDWWLKTIIKKWVYTEYFVLMHHALPVWIYLCYWLPTVLSLWFPT